MNEFTVLVSSQYSDCELSLGIIFWFQEVLIWLCDTILLRVMYKNTMYSLQVSVTDVRYEREHMNWNAYASVSWFMERKLVSQLHLGFSTDIFCGRQSIWWSWHGYAYVHTLPGYITKLTLTGTMRHYQSYADVAWSPGSHGWSEVIQNTHTLHFCEI